MASSLPSWRGRRPLPSVTLTASGAKEISCLRRASCPALAAWCSRVLPPFSRAAAADARSVAWSAASSSSLQYSPRRPFCTQSTATRHSELSAQQRWRSPRLVFSAQVSTCHASDQLVCVQRAATCSHSHSSPWEQVRLNLLVHRSSHASPAQVLVRCVPRHVPSATPTARWAVSKVDQAGRARRQGPTIARRDSGGPRASYQGCQ